MNPYQDDIEELEGPFEQTPGTTTASTSTGSSASSPSVEIVPYDGMTSNEGNGLAVAGITGNGDGRLADAGNEATAGVVGDEVPSNNGAKGEKHFVSPKKSDAIPATHAIFVAKGVSQEEFENAYEWEGGEAVLGAPLKRRVSRASTGKTVLTIKMKGGDQVVDRMNVWVIWATCAPRRVGTAVFTKFNATPAQQNPPRPAVAAGSEYAVPNNGFTWAFVFKIEPAEIFTAQDRPSLDGAQDKQHDVPGANKTYPTEPNNPNRHADEAAFKWDTSRQIKWAVTDSTGTTNPVAFPGEDAEGNDDAEGDGIDEADNPYLAYSGSSSLAHAVGEIASVDGPKFGRYINQGSTDGEKYIKDADFREFARVQLWDGKRGDGTFWFRISDHVIWHHYFRAKFKTHFFGDPTWEDDGSNESQP